MTLHPHDVRLAARVATYPNSTVEQETIRRVDGEVFERVATHEREMVRNANEWLTEADVHHEAADALEDSLRDEVRRVADRSTAVVNRDLATRYATLKQSAEKNIAYLESLARQAEFTADRLDRPYDEWCRIVSKYPTLMPRIEL